MGRIGAYPGTFNPLTVAHLEIAEAAAVQCRLDRVDLVLSRSPLGKESDDLAPLDQRLHVLEEAARHRPWLGVVLTDRQLVADIAEGYDVVILGADKWAQLNDVRFYGDDPTLRDTALARLPQLAMAPRSPHQVPAHAVVLDVSDHLDGVSATAARSGHHHLMADEARALNDRTGVWSRPGAIDADQDRPRSL